MENAEVYSLRTGRLYSEAINTNAPASIYLIDTFDGSFLVDVGSRNDGLRIEENDSVRYVPYLNKWIKHNILAVCLFLIIKGQLNHKYNNFNHNK